MTRWFLTLLAVLAGVSAHLAPAQARVRQAEASEINLVEALADQSEAISNPAPVQSRPEVQGVNPMWTLAPAALPVSTVQLKADRARE